MQFAVHVNLDNDDFVQGGGLALADALQKMVDQVRDSTLSAGRVFRIKDVNGNRVGYAAVSDV
jgi:hypothetical protein